jgi:hypothetical protein
MSTDYTKRCSAKSMASINVGSPIHPPALFTHRQKKMVGFLAFLSHSLSSLDTIRYLSLHDNQYIRYFKGHRQRYGNYNDTLYHENIE